MAKNDFIKVRITNLYLITKLAFKNHITCIKDLTQSDELNLLQE